MPSPRRIAAQWKGTQAGPTLHCSGVPAWVPSQLVHLGDLDRLDYISDKFDDIVRIWEHHFDHPPPLVADPASGTLLILGYGTRYTLTEGGIDDVPPKYTEIIQAPKQRCRRR
jgi:hypothetical protein